MFPENYVIFTIKRIIERFQSSDLMQDGRVEKYIRRCHLQAYIHLVREPELI